MNLKHVHLPPHLVNMDRTRMTLFPKDSYARVFPQPSERRAAEAALQMRGSLTQRGEPPARSRRPSPGISIASWASCSNGFAPIPIDELL